MIYQKLRGVDDEPVKIEPVLKNKSIMSLKNFRQITKQTSENLKPVLQLLVNDITMRIIDYFEDTGLLPTVLAVNYYNIQNGSHQKSDSIKLMLPVIGFKQTIESVA
jgi:DNA polymerase eta